LDEGIWSKVGNVVIHENYNFRSHENDLALERWSRLSEQLFRDLVFDQHASKCRAGELAALIRVEDSGLP
jgi:hypothetical protein